MSWQVWRNPAATA